MVKLTHIHTGLIKFYAQEIAPLYKSFMFFGSMVPTIINNFIRKNANIIDLLIDENGDVDIDSLHINYKTYLENNGPFTVRVLKQELNFDASDVDKIVAIIKAEVPVAPTITTPTI